MINETVGKSTAFLSVFPLGDAGPQWVLPCAFRSDFGIAPGGGAIQNATMMNPRLFPVSILLAALLLVGPALRAHEATEAMVAAASDFLNNLEPEKRAKAMFELKDAERTNWHYIPTTRNGLPIKDMREDQQHLACALLSTGLSHRGFTQALTVMSLEQVLWELENHSEKRNPEGYFVSIFGNPVTDKIWAWRFEGHHLSINFTIADGEVVASTPNFYGANPGFIKEGPRKGLRVLAAEEDQARAFIKSLDEAQQKAAIIDATAPKDVLTLDKPKVEALEHKGIMASTLTPEQQKALHGIIEIYVSRLRPSLAEADMKKIDAAGFDKIQFAWAGGLEMGQGQYYRIQGPTFLFEYANVQNDAYHPHAVWREFDGDFGEDVLRKHFAQFHDASGGDKTPAQTAAK